MRPATSWTASRAATWRWPDRLRPFLLVFIAYWVLYRVVPSQKVTFGDVWPGASWRPCCGRCCVGYTVYVTQFANFEDLFGPLAAIITLIVFIYFASVVLLIGAEVARANLIEPAGVAERARGRFTLVTPGKGGI